MSKTNPLQVNTKPINWLAMKIGLAPKPDTSFCDFVGCYDKHIAYIEELHCYACPDHVIAYTETFKRQRHDKNILRKA